MNLGRQHDNFSRIGDCIRRNFVPWKGNFKQRFVDWNQMSPTWIEGLCWGNPEKKFNQRYIVVRPDNKMVYWWVLRVTGNCQCQIIIVNTINCHPIHLMQGSFAYTHTSVHNGNGYNSWLSESWLQFHTAQSPGIFAVLYIRYQSKVSWQSRLKTRISILYDAEVLSIEFHETHNFFQRTLQEFWGEQKVLNERMIALSKLLDTCLLPCNRNCSFQVMSTYWFFYMHNIEGLQLH